MWLSDAAARLYADLAEQDRATTAAALRTQYPAFQALLTYRLAVAAATVTILDDALLDLALQDGPIAPPGWVSKMSTALAA